MLKIIVLNNKKVWEIICDVVEQAVIDGDTEVIYK